MRQQSPGVHAAQCGFAHVLAAVPPADTEGQEETARGTRISCKDALEHVVYYPAQRVSL